MQIMSESKADYAFLSALCGLKGVGFHRAQGSTSAEPTLKWGASTIIGLEAAALGLELLAPTPGLFPNGNAGMPIALMHWRHAMLSCDDSQKRATNLLLIERQMADGRDFLQGHKAGFADLCAYSWAKFDVAAGSPLLGWCERMMVLSNTQDGTDCPSLEGVVIKDQALSLSRDGGQLILTANL